MSKACFLRNDKEDFVPRFVTLQGNEIYFFKSCIEVPHHEKMYSLTGCFLKNEPDEMKKAYCKKTNRQYYPICIAVTPTKVFTFYFDDKLDS